MPDNKYGRIFIEGDVLKILEYVVGQLESAEFDTPELVEQEAIDLLREAMEEGDIRFKFEDDEPLFVLRGHDKRAVGAIKHYLEHQGPNAPDNHINSIMSALRSFDTYRQENPGQVREPD